MLVYDARWGRQTWMSSFSLFHWIIVLLFLAALVYGIRLLVRRSKARSYFLGGFAAGFGLALVGAITQFSWDKLFPAPGAINVGVIIDLLLQTIGPGVMLGAVVALFSGRRQQP
jgi:hypothetical protein